MQSPCVAEGQSSQHANYFGSRGRKEGGTKGGVDGSLIVVYLHGGLERLEFTAAGEDVELPEVVTSHAKFLEFRACLIND